MAREAWVEVRETEQPEILFSRRLSDFTCAPGVEAWGPRDKWDGAPEVGVGRGGRRGGRLKADARVVGECVRAWPRS